MINNKILLVFIILLLNLLMGGAVSASGLYNGSVSADNIDSVKSSGVCYALLVGVSTYRDASNNLDGVQYDVPNMRDMLINDCGYSSSGITSLTDSQATKGAIRTALIQMSSRAGPDDTFVFYFSGHGYMYPSNYGTSYLEPYNTDTYSVNNDISSSELKQWLDGIHCRNVLVVIDACEAEGMLKSGTKELVTSPELKAGDKKISGAERFSENFIGPFGSRNNVAYSTAEQQKSLSGNQYVVLLSCRSGEGSWTNAVTGSWFTTYLVEGTGKSSTDKNNDKWVSAEEAFYYASPLTTIKHSDQHPVIYDGDPANDLLMAWYGASSTGTIDVTSSPSGAAVYLDGKSTGYITPVTLTGVSAGSHTVRCTMMGYTDQSQSVTVNAGQATGVSYTLQSQGPVKGSISVSSSPLGAKIYIDGTDTGYTTPRTIGSIPVGTHTVRCTMTGYTDQSQSVTVSAGRTSAVKVYLIRQGPVTGSISVSSSPSGARIYLDGTDTGFTTPVTLTGISAGSHTVRCTMTGYTDKSQGVMVNAGQTTGVSLTLQGQGPVTGSISVSSSPSGARVYLDGNDTGVTTPATLNSVATGSHTVTCKITGYTDKSQSVTVNAGQTAVVSLALQGQVTATGSIFVSSSPSGARISMDGSDTGYTTPKLLSGVPVGSHTIGCSLAGYSDKSQSVTVSAGRTSTVGAYLTRQGPLTGSISVSSSPSGARIYLDGTDTGFTTPVTLTGISAGSHMVRCSLAGYTDQSRGVTVNAGQTATVTLDLPVSGSSTGPVYTAFPVSRAQLYLDNNYATSYTPKTFTKVLPGAYTLLNGN